MGKGRASVKRPKTRISKDSDAKTELIYRPEEIAKINNFTDAGFVGEDVFGFGEDEVFLEPSVTNRGVTSNEFHIQDTEEEVLPLNLSRDADYDFASNGRSNIQSSLKPTKKIFTKGKNLLPLKNARTSRFDRPANTLSHNFTDFVETAVDVTSKDSLSDQTDIEEDEVEIDAEDSWGRVGGYHVSKREVLQGEADERGKGSQEDNNREQLELFEVCRIQKNARQRLQEDDYGCDVMDETQAHKQEESSSKSASMAATATINFSDAKGAITHLLATEPELLALLDDFALSSVKLNPTRAAVRNLQINSANNYPKLGFGLLYRDILIIYMAVLTYYACIRSSPIYQQVGAILARNVLPRIVDLREALSVLEDLGVVSLPDEESRESAYANDERAWDERAIDCQNILPSEASDSKYQDIQAEVQENKRIDGMKSDFPARKRSMYENDRTSYEGNDPIAYMPPRKRRKRRAAKVSLHSSKSDIPSKASTIPKPHPISDMDLLEANTLTDAEASEKAGRRKSLRFYTSKIDAKAAKRSDAGVARAGGDSDVPYRSKERARAAVLQRQQNVHSSIVTGTRQDSEELGEVDFQSFGQAMRDTDAEGYYDLVAREKRALKFAKKEAYDETRENERADSGPQRPIDPNLPRAVNRQIMANKGLTPKRPKSVRNPRVKKRLRYDKAQKKVASTKPIYKGGLVAATYEGEKSGISSRVVKSRSL